MKYNVQLVKNSGEVVDQSSELLDAETAIRLIKAWESIVGLPAPRGTEEAKNAMTQNQIIQWAVGFLKSLRR